LRDDLLLRLLAAARARRASVKYSRRARRAPRPAGLADRRRAGGGGTGLGRLGLEAEIAHLETHLAWLEVCRRVLLDDAHADSTSEGAAPVDPRPPARAMPVDRGAAASVEPSAAAKAGPAARR
jgi:hypothetical protein